MEYLLVAALLLVVVLPILAVLPSPRERAQARMRLAAREAGLAVRLATLPTQPPSRSKRPRQLMAYTAQRPPAASGASWRLERQATPDAKLPRLGGLTAAALPPGLSQPLLTFLETQVGKLPLDVEQIEEIEGVISIYWHERQPGTERQVIDFLAHCRQIGA